jgi:hypothetical protein
MLDRLFTATLTFCLLIGGTLAIASAMLGTDQRVAVPHAASEPAPSVQLERVVVVGKRLASATAVAPTDADNASAPRVQ